MQQINRIYDHLANQGGSADGNLLRSFSDFIKSQNTDAHGARYLTITLQSEPILRNRSIHLRSRTASNDEDARQKLMRYFERIEQPSSKNFVYGMIQWAFRYCFDEFCEFLTDKGFNEEISDGPPPIYDAFISWSGDYGDAVARTIKTFLDEIGGINTFLSSESIRGGSWRSELDRGMVESAKGIVIYTQDSIDSDYINFEFSALSRLDRDVTSFRFDCPLAIIPAPLRDYQSLEYTEKSMADAIKRILGSKRFDSVKKDLPSLFQDIEEIRKKYSSFYVTSQEARWRNTGRPILMPEQSTSAYDLEECLRIAKEDIILVAQNHYFMTISENGGDKRFWPQILETVKRGVDVTIIGMSDTNPPPTLGDTTAPDAMTVWSLYMEAPGFKKQAELTWSLLREWKVRHDEIKTNSDETIGDLTIVGAYFLPFSVKLIDRATEKGLAIISPRMALKSADARPEIVIRRKSEPQAFFYFQHAVEYGLFNPFDSGWTKLFENEDSVS